MSHYRITDFLPENGEQLAFAALLIGTLIGTYMAFDQTLNSKYDTKPKIEQRQSTNSLKSKLD